MDNGALKNARKTLSQFQLVSVQTSSTLLVTPSPHRVALIISSPQSSRVTLSLDQTAVAHNGIILYGGGAPLTLTLADHGDLVLRGWTAISSSGAQDIPVIEVFLEPEQTPTSAFGE